MDRFSRSILSSFACVLHIVSVYSSDATLLRPRVAGRVVGPISREKRVRPVAVPTLYFLSTVSPRESASTREPSRTRRTYILYNIGTIL
jgi:hypothetical protein